MHRFYIFFIALIFLLSEDQLFGQVSDNLIGYVSQEDLEMETYDKDPLAEAVVLIDKGLSSFEKHNNRLKIVFRRATRIKILDKAGFKYAEVRIPIYHERGQSERVTKIVAKSYHWTDGKRTESELDQNQVYKKKINELWDQLVFAIPDVKEGSVIEYSYELHTPFKFKLPDWEFQRGIPTVYSEYQVRMVPFYEYQYIFQGTESLDHHLSYAEQGIPRKFANTTFYDMVHIYGMADVPAFRDESFITSKNDYIIKVDFQLSKYIDANGTAVEVVSTWERLIKNLLKDDNFGKFINASERHGVKLLQSEIKLAGLTMEEKAEKLINYVRDNFTWSGFDDKLTNVKFPEFLRSKTGNSAAINLFLVGLLRAASIEATPVLISTRNHGKVKYNYPFAHFFNYPIVLVQSLSPFLTDATDPFCPYDLIPKRCINEQGLLMRKDFASWLKLNLATTESTVFINGRIPEQGHNWGVKVSKKTKSYDALALRKLHGNDSSRLVDVLQKPGYHNLKILKTSNFSKPQKPYSIQYSIQTKLDEYEGHLYVSPFLEEVPGENPLKQKQRNYPIDLVFSQKRVFNSTILLPENSSVVSVPENVQLNNELVQIIYQIQTLNQSINVSASYTFKHAEYAAEDYGQLKEFYDLIIEKFNQKIVLKRE